MIVLEPIEHQTIWGGSILKDRFGCKNDKIGHLYMVNGHKDMSNRILNGVYNGKTLEQVFPIVKGEWGVEEYDEFPLTVALVDATENLSIQVHPNDEIANQIEGKRIGKEESWLFLKAPDEGYIYCGSQVNESNDIRIAIISGKFLNVVSKLPIRKDDYVCVKAGTLHAMSAGSFVYEIEYGSDYTYRFYDYHRKDKEGKERELHIEKALKSIDLNQKSKVVKCKDDCWMVDDNYEICRMKNRNSFHNNFGKLVIVSIIDGRAVCDGVYVRPGMSIIVFPGETVEEAEFKDIIVSKLR